MKNFLKIFSKKYFFRFFAAFVFSLVCIFPVSSQSKFPNGSTRGNTEMTRGVSGLSVPNIDVNITQPRTGEQIAFSVQVLLALTILTLAPSILILCTCFLRFSIVLDFIKRSLSLQQVPPTAVLNGIALFMTLFIMFPVFQQVYNKSFKPLSDGNITIEQAYKEAEGPIKIFMYNQIGNTANGKKYIASFMNMARLEKPNTLADIPTYVIVPAYILHELTVAFKIGVFLYIPFIVIDMVVASVLMSMGMMMLPPVQISMPFKLMVFVIVDGWGLLTQQLFNSIIK